MEKEKEAITHKSQKKGKGRESKSSGTENTSKKESPHGQRTTPSDDQSAWVLQEKKTHFVSLKKKKNRQRTKKEQRRRAPEGSFKKKEPKKKEGPEKNKQKNRNKKGGGKQLKTPFTPVGWGKFHYRQKGKKRDVQGQKTTAFKKRGECQSKR